jgi:hypothetical protein
MQRKDMIVGGVYAVEVDHRRTVAKATLTDLDARMPYGRAKGIEFELAAPVETRDWRRVMLPVGHKVVVIAQHVRHDWTDADEEAMARLAARLEQRDRLRAMLAALGIGDDDNEGGAEVGARTTSIDNATLIGLLSKIPAGV